MRRKLITFMIVNFFLISIFSNFSLAFINLDKSNNLILSEENPIKFNNTISEIINLVNESTVRFYLEKIVNIYPDRETGSEGSKNLGNYIFDEFKNTNFLNVWKDEWSDLGPLWNPGLFNDYNIMGQLSGNQEDNVTYLFLVHHDATEGSPGADDDGSGVAALLTAVKILSKYSFNNTILFCSSSGEEQGLLGDFCSAKKAYDENMNIAGALTADAIGYMIEGKPSTNKVRLYKPERSNWIADIIEQVNTLYIEDIGLNGVIKASYHGNSGHKAYEDYGFDALKFFEGVTNPGWEEPPHTNDTIDKINFSYLTKVTKLIVGTLATLANLQKREPYIKIISPREDIWYKKGLINTIALSKGQTCVSDSMTLKLEVKEVENIERVEFKILEGENEHNQEDRIVLSEFIDDLAPYEWNIEESKLGWTTVRATAYDFEGNYNCDEIEIKFSPHPFKSKSRLINLPFMEQINLFLNKIFEKILA